MSKQLTHLIIAVLIALPALAHAELKWTGCGISKKAYMTELADAFEQAEGVSILVSGGGATKGIRDTAAGKSDLGGACRHLILEDAEKGVKLHAVAWDALVIITHKENAVDDISYENLKKVFSGEITNWKDLGGEDAPVEVLLRKGSISGVGMMARELIFGDANYKLAGSREFRSTGPLEKAVESSRYAIAIDGISSAKKRDLKILELNGIAPTVENISSGKYLLFRPLYIATAAKMTPDVQKFIKFVKSPEGQEVIASQGTVTLSQGSGLWKPYREHMKTVAGNKKGVFE